MAWLEITIDTKSDRIGSVVHGSHSALKIPCRG